MRDYGRIARADILASPLDELIEDVLADQPTPPRPAV
jgi:hypothetical protein